MLQRLPHKCEVLVPTSGKQKSKERDAGKTAGCASTHIKRQMWPCTHAKPALDGVGETKHGKVEFVGHHPSSRFSMRTCLKK